VTASGRSLVGLLLIVVILGALTASAIVGLRSMTASNASSRSVLANASAAGNVANRVSEGASPGVGAIRAGVACNATADAARSASSVYFAKSGGKPPVRWSDLTIGTPPIYKLPTNVTINATNPKELDGRGWKLIISGTGATAPTFTCP